MMSLTTIRTHVSVSWMATRSRDLVQGIDETGDEESVMFAFSRLRMPLLLLTVVVIRVALSVANFCNFLVQGEYQLVLSSSSASPGPANQPLQTETYTFVNFSLASFVLYS